MPTNKRRNALDQNSTVGIVREIKPDASFRAVTPSNTVNIASGPARALYIGVTGDVVAVNENGVAVTFKNVVQGSILPISTVRVNELNTNAESIIAL